jgi:hypothetical protein
MLNGRYDMLSVILRYREREFSEGVVSVSGAFAKL